MPNRIETAPAPLARSSASSAPPPSASATRAPSASSASPPRARVLRGLALVGGLGLVAILLASGAVPCAFARTTHLPCPGCGSTRAVQALLAGDLHGVVHTNPFGPVMAALVAVFAADAALAVFRDGDTRRLGSSRLGRFASRALLVVAVLEVALWIARFFGAFGGPVPV